MKPDAHSTSNRIAGFDWLRFWAIVAVVAIHTSDLALRKNQFFPAHTIEGDLYYAFSACLRFCVPSFLMMSAFLNETRLRQTGKSPVARWKRYAVPLAVATVFYTLLTVLQTKVMHKSVEVSSLLILAVTGRAYYHVWFLYNLLCYTLLHPVLRKLTTPWIFAGILTLYTIAFIDNGAPLFNLLGHRSPWLVEQNLFLAYFLLGLAYYLLGIWAANHTERLQGLSRPLVGIFLIVGVAVACRYGVLLRQNSFFTLGAEMLSLGTFCLALQWKSLPSSLPSRIAALSLGIYLWHPFVLLLVRLREGRLYRDAVSPAVTFTVMIVEFAVGLGGSYLIAQGLARLRSLRSLAQ